MSGRGSAGGVSRALTRLAQFPEPLLEREFFGVLDVCNHRVDAWFTALATKRLESLRATGPQGVVIGGWGCLQDVRRTDVNDPRRQAEYIHTPSLNQAAAAAVMRSAALRATNCEQQPRRHRPSSRRVRLARWILEGVRNGRSLGELLGVRFERAVKGTPAEAHLAALRRRSHRPPGSACWTDCGCSRKGPALSPSPRCSWRRKGCPTRSTPWPTRSTAEAVYQIVKGNPENAIATLERIAKGEEPPALTVTQSPTPGVRLTHRVAVVLPANASAPGWSPWCARRARARNRCSTRGVG